MTGGRTWVYLGLALVAFAAGDAPRENFFPKPIRGLLFVLLRLVVTRFFSFPGDRLGARLGENLGLIVDRNIIRR
jgi:hypothetical protein